MREIKFRAWHKNIRYMFEVDVLSLVSNEVIVKRASVFADPVLKKNFVLMQYTGLKDKNGREIYELDIVKYSDNVGVVKWDNDMVQFYVTNRTSADLEAFWANIHKAEVIGNIYNNPELIHNDKVI